MPWAMKLLNKKASKASVKLELDSKPLAIKGDIVADAEATTEGNTYGQYFGLNTFLIER